MARIALVAVLLNAAASARAEPCNPVIDGTYCATQMTRRSSASTYSRDPVSPMQGIARDLGHRTDAPTTLGGITFRSGGETCMGLFRRGVCN